MVNLRDSHSVWPCDFVTVRGCLCVSAQSRSHTVLEVVCVCLTICVYAVYVCACCDFVSAWMPHVAPSQGHTVSHADGECLRDCVTIRMYTFTQPVC